MNLRMRSERFETSAVATKLLPDWLKQRRKLRLINVVGAASTVLSVISVCTAICGIATQSTWLLTIGSVMVLMSMAGLTVWRPLDAKFRYGVLRYEHEHAARFSFHKQPQREVAMELVVKMTSFRLLLAEKGERPEKFLKLFEWYHDALVALEATQREDDNFGHWLQKYSDAESMLESAIAQYTTLHRVRLRIDAQING